MVAVCRTGRLAFSVGLGGWGMFAFNELADMVDATQESCRVMADTDV